LVEIANGGGGLNPPEADRSVAPVRNERRVSNATPSLFVVCPRFARSGEQANS